MVAISPASNESLDVYRVYLDQALDKSGNDSLIVVSQPAASVARGAAYTYSVVAKSNKGRPPAASFSF